MDPLVQRAESLKYSSAHVVHLVEVGDGLLAVYDITRRHLLGLLDISKPEGCALHLGALLRSRPIPPVPQPRSSDASRAKLTAKLLKELTI